MKTEDRNQKTKDADRFSGGGRATCPPPVPPSHRRPLSPSSYRPRGFSFTEILFAIMILGIGFIMVAAMFPVAIKQTETSREENVGAAVARSGVAYVQQMAFSNFYQISPTAASPGDKLCVLRPTLAFPVLGAPDDQTLYNATKPGSTSNLASALPTVYLSTPGSYDIPGMVWDFQTLGPANIGAEPVVALANANGYQLTSNYLSGVLASMTSENMVQTADPRFAWIAFYKRDLIMTVTAPGKAIFSFAPSAQVIVIATQVRTGQSYQLTPPTPPATSPHFDLPIIPPSASAPIPTPPSLQASRSLPGNPATITPPNSTHLDFSISFQDQTQANRAAEGAFVIIAQDFLGPNVPAHGLLNGRVYRLGGFDSTVPGWRFAPGYGPTSGSDLAVISQSNKFVVYLVGKGQDPDNPIPGSYTGLAQDIAVYSTFISCPSN